MNLSVVVLVIRGDTRIKQCLLVWELGFLIAGYNVLPHRIGGYQPTLPWDRRLLAHCPRYRTVTRRYLFRSVIGRPVGVISRTAPECPSQRPFIESELAHCHDPGTATPSRSVTVAVNSVPIWGCNGEMYTLPILVDVGDGDRQVEFAQVIPVIVVGGIGGAVLAAGAEPHRYPVDVVRPCDRAPE